MPQMTQEEYIAILFSDCGYDTSAQRRGWLQKRFSAVYADELSTTEKSRAIKLLKEEKGTERDLRGAPYDGDPLG